LKWLMGLYRQRLQTRTLELLAIMQLEPELTEEMHLSAAAREAIDAYRQALL
jgi:hypothetical protein